MIKKFLLFAVVACTAAVGGVKNAVAAEAGDFYLKGGDRVVFYGDSITDQRLYRVFP